jgi:oxygen-independent coproporphyrinogen-3 oxidase
VAEALALAPEHLSVYGLTIEPRTVFGRREVRGELTALDPDAAADEYLWCAAALAAAGYEHYETSSFARPGRRSHHNSRYWAGGDYLGLGPAAHSLWRGRRRANVRSLERWAAGVEAGSPERETDQPADASSLYAETVYLGLRSSDGLKAGSLAGDPAKVGELRAGLVAEGLAGESSGRLVLTDRGHLLLDEIAARLLALGETGPVAGTACGDGAARPHPVREPDPSHP